MGIIASVVLWYSQGCNVIIHTEYLDVAVVKKSPIHNYYIDVLTCKYENETGGNPDENNGSSDPAEETDVDEGEGKSNNHTSVGSGQSRCESTE